MTLANEVLELLVLLLGEALGLDRVDADGLADARRDGEAVAREDRDAAHAELAQLRDDLARVAAELVLEPDRTEVAPVRHHMHARHALDLGLYCLDLGRERGVQLDDPRPAAREDLAVRGGGGDAAAVDLAVRGQGLRLDPRALGGLEDRLRERVVRRLLRVGGGLQERGALDALRGREAADGELARRERSGLVHHDRVDVGGRLERAGLLDHHAEARGGCERGHHRGRVGDEQGPGAGDDEHGDRALGGHGLRVGRARLRGEEPHDQRHHQDDGDVVGGDPLDELLLLALRALGFADQLLDLADGRLALDGGDLDVDLSREVRGACVHGRARLHLDRDGFARERRLVDARGARAHGAVGGEVLAGADAHDRPLRKLRERNLALRARLVDEARDVGGQLDQLADRALRAPGRAREDEFAEPEEERQEPRSEVELVGDRREDGEAGEAVARGAAFAQFLDGALRKRHHENERAHEGGNAGDRGLDAGEVGDPCCKKKHAAEERHEELPLEAFCAACIVAGPHRSRVRE